MVLFLFYMKQFVSPLCLTSGVSILLNIFCVFFFIFDSWLSFGFCFIKILPKITHNFFIKFLIKNKKGEKKCSLFVSRFLHHPTCMFLGFVWSGSDHQDLSFLFICKERGGYLVGSGAKGCVCLLVNQFWVFSVLVCEQ